VKLNQMFYKHGLNPPSDVIETASFLVTVTFVRRRGALGFVARGVGRQLERDGLAKVLDLRVPIELPPVGIITLRGRLRTPAAEQMIDCLRSAAKAARGRRSSGTTIGATERRGG
jgi:DNA-binding transcriptional LysR family regulator